MTTAPTHEPNPENRVVVVRQLVGWEVREEKGPVLLRSAIVTDWLPRWTYDAGVQAPAIQEIVSGVQDRDAAVTSACSASRR